MDQKSLNLKSVYKKCSIILIISGHAFMECLLFQRWRLLTQHQQMWKDTFELNHYNLVFIDNWNLHFFPAIFYFIPAIIRRYCQRINLSPGQSHIFLWLQISNSDWCSFHLLLNLKLSYPPFGRDMMAQRGYHYRSQSIWFKS